MTDKQDLLVVGWREWVSLPALGVDKVKAKVDTGARTSCLHAFDIEFVPRRRGTHVHFSVHPLQDNTARTVRCEVPLLDQRWVKSSNGKREYRPVVRTPIRLGTATWDIELTLTSRDLMGFRMLLGREALRRRLLVDANRSYCASPSRGESTKRKKKKKRTIHVGSPK